ncbi:choline/carnitine/betaine transporter [Xylanimonas cellulosilytica DSM 15894]|uniref:Choline/carnitine/betaine transporter n=1 Tax=Xylanimonas cellulosilytica (strain DSM 15894 / JCM 12276 / CECT 5975 / KCTC 9989 / LMG 20990 / NBRC 107835 / XIL07) TaxID=446471 RepID=D1BV40_XYLCX|nr:BCCT family transporter [Xylanimonas cellulosilytica]ACZ31279.1 choline/carnitine/betaine transporter [Xylanimonas cellulosilytica DSM 15894]
MTGTTTSSDSGGEPHHTNGASRHRTARLLHEVSLPQIAEGLHPALLPGISVEDNDHRFGVNKAVLGIAFGLVVGVIAWGVLAADSLHDASEVAFAVVTEDFGWFFGVLMLAVFGFMMWLGFGRYRSIRLGQDGEQPEFSTASWVAMIFAAGIGIGLLFYGPLEPTTHFTALPPTFEGVEPGSDQAMHLSLAQTMFHWGPIAWSIYALVGGAVAYASFRKGRAPLMSALLEPIFGARTRGPLGAFVDIFAIIVTLFGTAVSLGIGTLQIGRGVEIVAGIGPLGNAALVGIIALLGVAFVVSAVSGVKRGIRVLSNVNMVLTGAIALFVFVAGPTVLLLNLLPGALMTFLGEFPALAAQSGATSEDAQSFMSGWTTYYWAWWVSWTPFVGLFIAKISRGRTLREFVLTVIIVPTLVCLVWFTVLGGTSMWLEQAGAAMTDSESGQDMLFALLDNLPAGVVTSAIAMVCVGIFFVTSADSASIVMASLAEKGNPAPRRWNTIVWGSALAVIAAVLLVGGGSAALSGLQNLMMVTALPFAFIIVLVMVAWSKELARDPQTIRRRFARVALARGVREGIEQHGDDFVVGVVKAHPEKGAGAWLDTDDPGLTAWYSPGSGSAGAQLDDGTLLAEARNDESRADEDPAVDPSVVPVDPSPVPPAGSPDRPGPDAPGTA